MCGGRRSAANAAFWGALAGCVQSKALQELVQRLSAAEAADRRAGKAKGQGGRMDELCAEYNVQLVQKVRSAACVAGNGAGA